MDLMTRRKILQGAPNPDGSMDYLVNLSGAISPNGKTISVCMRYVPDKLVVQSSSLGDYLDALSKMDWPSPEDLAVTIISDFNNELVPRWVQVSLSTPENEGGLIETHGVTLEDRQPKWDNPGLLARLKQI